jgi:hypothetical protein
MRYVNAGLFAALMMFAVAQLNDPDPLLWFPIYAIPAAWAGMVAFRPHLLPTNWLMIAIFLACVVAAVVGTIDLWPTFPAGWIQNEETREGVGMMIVTVALVIAGLTWWRERGRPPAPV